MSSELAIRAEGIAKRYTLGQLSGGYKLISEALIEWLSSARRGSPRREEFWALRDISFEVRQGEMFGIIGHNGAGKSTLLKILSRVTPPTEGQIKLRGRVGALLEVGTGFHPELTGRENVFLNGAILGMNRIDIAKKFDEIVEFAGVNQFIDTPVKRYSSGMQLRLAFSVAAHLEPEVLIVDEVLSVGDLAFQRKCLGRIEAVAGEGRTVLLVSHNLGAVRGLCDRAALLSEGELVAQGEPDAIIDSYLEMAGSGLGIHLADRTDRVGNGKLRFVGVRFESEGKVIDTPISGRDFDIVISYETADGKPLHNVNFTAPIYTPLDELMLLTHSEMTGALFPRIPAVGEVRCHVPRCPLPAGQYLVTLWSDMGGESLDWVRRAGEMTVAEGDFYNSGFEPPSTHRSVLVDQEWTVTAAADSAGDGPAASQTGARAATPGPS